MSTLQYAEARFLSTNTFPELRQAARTTAHARRCYLAAARFLEEEGLQVMAHAFRFTAAQETEHAAVCRGLLSSYSRMTLPVTEDRTVSLNSDALSMLHAAADAEEHMAGEVYSALAHTAAKEGFPRIARALRCIAETEQGHARRFRQYAKAWQDGTLFHAEQRVGWLCLRCGQLCYGQEPPRQCSGCGCGQGAFIRSNFSPFALD